MKDDDRLVRLAAEIADGTDVPWSEVEQRFAGEARELADELRLLQQVADVHTRAEPSRQTLEPGTAWGSLRIVERIGFGTFGEVYRAFDPRLDRDVALKVLYPPSVHQSSVETLPASAIVDEGRLMARVRHPGVVTVHGAERVGGQVGVWMELVEGQTLAQEVAEQGPLPAEEVHRIGLHLADALAAVHDAGVLHRDVKAQNVMRERTGRIVLMDFGTGLDLRDGARALAGTPLYLAPEVIAGEAATERSDIYSLGVLLFHLATGEFPVRGYTLAALRDAHAHGERRTIRSVTRTVPFSLARVIERATAADPASRFASADAFVAALRVISPAVRRQRLLVVAGVAVLVAAAGLSIATLRSRPAAPALLTGVVEQQIDVALQQKAQIRGPAVGEWIPCHPRGSFGIARCNLRDGSIRPLRMPVERGEGSPAARARFSADGEWLAYQWQTRSGTTPQFSVNLIAADGSRGRELYRADKRLDIQGWTTGDEAVVVREVLEPDRQRLLLIPAGGDPVQELLALTGVVTGTDLSPDGQSVLVTRLVAEQHDVALIDVATGVERWVVADRTDDHGAIWTPDGRGVIFISDRTGCDGLAFMPLDADGSPGVVTIVKDLGRNRGQPFGFSPDGSYLLQLDYARRTAYRTPIDLERRTAGAAVPLVARCKEQSTGASWHPAGESVAFLTGGLLFGDAHVVIQTMTGRVERELASGGRFALFGRARWSPDGRTLAIRKSGPREMDVLSLLDVATGELREVARGTDQDREDDKIREVRWSADGRTLFYQRDNAIRAFHVGSGDDQLIYRYAPAGPTLLAGFDVRHSDGAFVIQEPIDEDKRCRMRVLQGTAIVDRGELNETCTAVAWSHDGTRILAATFTSIGRLWVFDHEVGEPWQLPLPADMFWDLSVSPDGRELLFSAGNPRSNMVILRGLSGVR
jgi:Tol biopolymer transport system component